MARPTGVHRASGEVVPLDRSPAPSATAPLRVLCLDSDLDHGRELLLRLAPAGIDVTLCADGPEALLRAGLLRPDLALVNSDVPGLPVRRIVELLRTTLDIPVIVGIAADAAAGMEVLSAQPTACVPYPYDVDVLMPLIRSSGVGQGEWLKSPEILRVGPLALNTASHQAWLGEKPLALPRREFQVLRYLMLRAGRVVHRSELQSEIWNSDKGLTNNTITVHIRRLRRRLDRGEAPRCVIHTVRGVGYRLDVEASPAAP